MNKLDKLQMLTFFKNFGPFWPTLARSPHWAGLGWSKAGPYFFGPNWPDPFWPQPEWARPEWAGPARFPAILGTQWMKRLLRAVGGKMLKHSTPNMSTFGGILRMASPVV